jgi:hypothetical protein
VTNDTHRDQRELEARTKRLFDRSVADIDATTLARLTRARRRAIDESVRSRLIGKRTSTFAFGTLAAGCGAVVLAWLLMDFDEAPTEELVPVADVADLEVLLDEDALEMYEELDFYAWLEQQPEVQPIENSSG